MCKIDFCIKCSYGKGNYNATSLQHEKEYANLDSFYDFCFKKVKTIVEDVFNCKSWDVIRVKEDQLTYIEYEIGLYDSVYGVLTIEFIYNLLLT